jgi:heat shock protein HslJ
LIILVVMLVSACQPAPAPTEPPAPPTPQPPSPTEPVVVPTEEVTEPVDLAPELVDKLWLLVAFGDAANPAVVEEGTVVTALFSSDGTLSGSGGCNNYSTTYELNGDALTVGSPIASTMMFCEQGMNQETAVLAALQSAQRIAFTDEGRLEIFYDTGGSSERKLVYVLGETPLVDTVWVLESMGAPDNPTAIQSGTIITAIFSSEGTLSGTSSCNNYSAGYTAEDGQLEIQQPISTMMACTQGMEQEAAYLEALIGAETYQITGARLEISYDGGAGVLRYTSRNLTLENTLWTLVMMNGAPNTIGLVATTALFDPGAEPQAGAVGGVAMCNNYRGSYTVEEDTLTVTELAATKIRCPETVMQAEATYLELLETAQTYQVLGQTLIVTSEKGLLIYVANRSPLEGTNWRLTAMGPATSPQAPVAGADFTAQFVRQQGVPSGLMVGATGCNDYNAVYAANLTEIKINIPSRTNNSGCAAGLPEQEMQYYLALNAATSYRILGDTLQMFYGDGQALSFVAFVPAPPPPSVGPLTGLNGTRWWLVSMRNIVPRPGTQITADFAINPDGETGTISGNAGCNNYNAPILGVFQVGPAATTKMFCAEPVGVMEQESSYLALLSTANSITQINNQLLIGTVGGLLVYYNAPVPVIPVEPTPTATAELPSTPTPEPPTPEPGTPTPEAPTPEPPTPEPPTPEPPTPVPPTPTQEPVVPVPPIATEPVVPVPPIATEPVVPVPPIAMIPTAVISAPNEGEVGEKIIFDARGSTAQAGIASYTWNFGDGTISEGVLVEHAFFAPGIYTVTLTVMDFSGQAGTDTVTIMIN